MALANKSQCNEDAMQLKLRRNIAGILLVVFMLFDLKVTRCILHICACDILSVIVYFWGKFQEQLIEDSLSN